MQIGATEVLRSNKIRQVMVHFHHVFQFCTIGACNEPCQGVRVSNSYYHRVEQEKATPHPESRLDSLRDSVRPPPAEWPLVLE